jgi:hypothetical protein
MGTGRKRGIEQQIYKTAAGRASASKLFVGTLTSLQQKLFLLIVFYNLYFLINY